MILYKSSRWFRISGTYNRSPVPDCYVGSRASRHLGVQRLKLSLSLLPSPKLPVQVVEPVTELVKTLKMK